MRKARMVVALFASLALVILGTSFCLAEDDEAARERLEEIREQKAELRELRRECRERLAEYDEQQDEIENEDEDEDDVPTAERLAQKRARLSYINECRVIVKKILEVRNVASLAKAHELEGELELKELEWDWVREPELDRAVEIAEMKREATEVPDADLLRTLKEVEALSKARNAAARKQFEMMKSVRRQDKAIEAKLEAFWSKLEKLEAEEEED